MTIPKDHPNNLVIIPPKTDDGSYQWAILRNGKVVRRSDRNYMSEVEARETALAEIDKLLSGEGDRGAV